MYHAIANQAEPITVYRLNIKDCDILKREMLLFQFSFSASGPLPKYNLSPVFNSGKFNVGTKLCSVAEHNFRVLPTWLQCWVR